MSLVVGIDASRNRSGGAKAHLVGILTGSSHKASDIREVHVWAYKSLMDLIPDYPWLIKHTPEALERSLIHQVWWQYRNLPREARENGCDILFNTDAGTVCPFRPGVTMSQDMLPFEPGEMKRFGLSIARLRLLLLRFIQARSLKNACGVIFLTDYAARVIQKTTGTIRRHAIIPHGVDEKFRRPLANRDLTDDSGRTFRFLFVSDVSMYKHQWNVVKAVGKIRESGYKVSLLLVGGGEERAQKLLERELLKTDPHGEFVKQKAFVDHDQIAGFLADADVFIFASSCENMPITLLEAMAIGLPIACSDRGPMPEILKDGGIYFDPENPDSIAKAIGEMIRNPALRKKLSNRAKELSKKYSWKKCSTETWRYLVDCAMAIRNAKTRKNNPLAEVGIK